MTIISRIVLRIFNILIFTTKDVCRATLQNPAKRLLIIYLYFSDHADLTSIIFFAQKYNQYLAAEDILLRLLRLKPSSIYIQNLLLTIYFYQGRINHMLDYFDKVLEQINLNSPQKDTLYLDSYFTYSIGHIGLLAYLALSIEVGISPFSRISLTVLPNQPIANKKLLDLVINRFSLIISTNSLGPSSAEYTLQNALSLPLLSGHYFQTQACQRIIAAQRQISCKPILTIPSSIDEYFKSWVQEYKIPTFDWFCVIHLRSRNDGSTRSSSKDLLPLISSSVKSLGGFTFILGDYYDTDPSFGLQDTFHVSSSNDPLGIVNCYLLANGRFAIHSPSGPVVISSSLFSVPTIQIDLIPTRNFLGSNTDLVIPKTYIHSISGEILPLRQQLKYSNSIVPDESVVIDNVDYIPQPTPPKLLESSIHQMYKLTSNQSNIHMIYDEILNYPNNQRFIQLLDPNYELGTPCLPNEYLSFFPTYLD